MNYFSLFGLAETFELDCDGLAHTYRQLQAQYHPDKFASATEHEQLQAVQYSALINDGFTTLKAPLSRAEHLLVLRGIERQSEQQTLQDAAFLVQQLEWRERLADVAKEGDLPHELAQLRQEIAPYQQTLLNALSTHLANNENRVAAEFICKLKFVNKLLEELEQVEDSQFDF